jgi:hypothetical protein
VGDLLREQGLPLHPGKSKSYGPGDTKLVTGLVIGSDLSLPADFGRDTEYLVQQASRGNWLENRHQILGRINWIAEFDPPRAAELRREFAKVSNRGGRFAAR